MSSVVDAKRAARLARAHRRAFPADRDVAFFSSPGRAEVGGNHTDHNGGRVLAAAVDVDILAAVSKCDANRVTMDSDGFGRIDVDLADLAMKPAERFTSAALVRGVCARLKKLGFTVGGFHAVLDSTIPKAAGLSSSAAFECLVAEIQNALYNNGRIDPVLTAQIAQYAENEYFGKPCGLMDQTTIAVGGLVTIDFKNFEKPAIRKVDADFAKSGYALVVVDTGGSHADLNDDYIALEHEMKSVAKALGREVLRQSTLEKVVAAAPRLRKKVGDRAVLRAIHFFDDDARVVEQVCALEKRDYERFLDLVNESGRSSFMYCQNCFLPASPRQQGISVAIALSEQILRGRGAWRVHGGGFAGTVQAFVPRRLLPRYLAVLGKTFGPRSCHALSIRPDGTRCVEG